MANSRLHSVCFISIALYQANFANKQTEGEAYISKTGGVGIFGEYGVREAWMKEKKWTRCVSRLTLLIHLS
jgi:hypothetical protein